MLKSGANYLTVSSAKLDLIYLHPEQLALKKGVQIKKLVGVLQVTH